MAVRRCVPGDDETAGPGGERRRHVVQRPGAMSSSSAEPAGKSAPISVICEQGCSFVWTADGSGSGVTDVATVSGVVEATLAGVLKSSIVRRGMSPVTGAAVGFAP